MSHPTLPPALALSFAPVVRQHALRIARRLPPHVSVEDLIGAGFMGLVDAYRRYEPARCDRFDAFAQHRIRGAMLDELRRHDVLTRELRGLANRIASTRRRLEVSLGRAVAEDELAEELAMPLETFRTHHARITSSPMLSLDLAVPGCPALDPCDPDEPGADVRLSTAQAKRTLDAAVGSLPARLRLVLEEYYVDGLTLRDIGERLGVTESRVCQLHADAIARLRAHYARRERTATHRSQVTSDPAPGLPRPQRTSARSPLPKSRPWAIRVPAPAPAYLAPTG
jgi:RNA polymerase sigma factor for flagellar operon FliA